jgi:hypothetical protein
MASESAPSLLTGFVIHFAVNMKRGIVILHAITKRIRLHYSLLSEGKGDSEMQRMAFHSK